MLILDGKPLSYDRAFSHDGVSYPANWLRLSTWEEKQRIGISEIPDPVQQTWDQRFYWGVDNPKDHTGLVELWVSKVKETAGTLLSPTDWYVTRNAENGAVIPQDVLDRRAEIRTYSNTKEVAIQATTTTDELVAYVTSPGFSEWEPPAPVEEPVSGSSEPVPAPAGNDTLSFETGTTSASIP
jgi:hypothetical protein